VFIPPIFKRLFADGPEYGVPYLTGADVFQTNSVPSRYLMHSVAEQYQLVVHKGTILVQEAGQLGGLIGRCVLAGRRLDSSAVTNNMVRIVARNPGDTGYLFALLASEPGATLLAREAAGSSIPHMDANRVRSLHLPWASAGIRKEVGQLVVDAYELRDQASEMESAAISAVEKAIEEAA
jgi:type I restriction enzyme S subunit